MSGIGHRFYQLNTRNALEVSRSVSEGNIETEWDLDHDGKADAKTIALESRPDEAYIIRHYHRNGFDTTYTDHNRDGRIDGFELRALKGGPKVQGKWDSLSESDYEYDGRANTRHRRRTATAEDVRGTVLSFVLGAHRFHEVVEVEIDREGDGRFETQERYVTSKGTY